MKRQLIFLGIATLLGVVLWGQSSNQNNFGGGSALPSGLAYVAPTLTVSTAGSGSAVLALSGNSSGTCTQTVNATSTTVTENCLHLGTAGLNTAPTYSFSASTNTGMFGAGGSVIFTSAGTNQVLMASGAAIRAVSSGVLGWSSGDPNVSATDTGLSRSAAGVVALGNASAGDTSSKLKAAGYMSVGTTFTSNAGCGDTTLVGGATAGKYTSVTAGTCTTIITMGNSASAPNGWSCTATDLTTIGDIGNIKQSATTQTTASLNETTVAGNDVIQFSCIGY